ncbi:hypothetical protein Desaf_0359 [Desulfocurvibacter africanus subsp. africanus str. Walvis Bay]|uniref:Uncharacterized protein n=1 Tax=Desulfocurvibacter africanus subsp. africanus str. Walvis Bay TaxID=690850 RepID=F3YUA9_DESAF|nr:hypothetical protein Desaf_0359 [Desulfocurvibacter africanus subsp. africanus str. Walvis Bay]
MVVGKERRRAYRISVPELRVRVAGYEYDFKAWDLSILGIGFMYGQTRSGLRRYSGWTCWNTAASLYPVLMPSYPAWARVWLVALS